MDRILFKGVVFGFLVILLVLVGVFFVFSNTQSVVVAPMNTRVCFENGACVTVEVADTSQKRETGLMNRTSLASDSGLLFVFDSPGKYAFWMKNTKIPLDIFWVDSQNYIVEIAKNVAPCVADPCPRFGGQKDAKFVVETNAGFGGQNGIRLNQKVEITGLVK